MKRLRRNRENFPPGSNPSSFSGWRITRRTAWWIAGIAIFLVCVRLALPWIARGDYVNHQLRKSHNYSGRIGKVTIHLWRGAYEIHDIDIFKATGKVSVPFFYSHILDLSLQWSELFHGALVSKIIMQGPSLNFVSGPAEAQSQTGTENNWGQTLESLVPFKINRLDIVQGRIHFLNPYSKPPVDILRHQRFGGGDKFRQFSKFRWRPAGRRDRAGHDAGRRRKWLS